MSSVESLKKIYSEMGYLNLELSKSNRMNSLRLDLDNLIKETFFDNKEWELMNSSDFYKYAYDCQKKINSMNFQKIFLEEHQSIISTITGMSNIFHESVIFLRAIRPSKKRELNDHIGFHRETMYSDTPAQTANAHNIWLPITEPTKETAVRYYPKSHLVPDEKLKWEEDISPNHITKGSYGHKLGSAYNPKKITMGLEGFVESQMLPNIDQYALFSAMTVHGAGVNNSNKIRLSLSMAMIDSKQISYNKPYLAAGGKPHYSRLNQ